LKEKSQGSAPRTASGLGRSPSFNRNATARRSLTSHPAAEPECRYVQRGGLLIFSAYDGGGDGDKFGEFDGFGDVHVVAGT